MDGTTSAQNRVAWALLKRLTRREVMSGNLELLSQPSLISQVRLLAAVARKDWQVFWRYPLNAISSVLQPIVWLVPVYFMGMAFSVNGKAVGFAGYSGTTDYMSFALIGTVLVSFINAVFWGMGYSLKEDMDAGVLEANWLAPASRLLIMAGRTFTSLVITTITSLLTLLVAGFFFGFQIIGNLWQAVLTALPMLIGLYSFGFAFAALVLIMREANTLVDMSSFLVQTFSGMTFPVNALPRYLLPIALILPLTYGFDAIRGFLLGTRTLLPIPLEIGLMLLFMAAMMIFGVWIFRKLERRVRMKGTLGQH
jgi:ABC-2 type transport system permease protein